MPKFDWKQVELRKNQHRAELAALPPEQKVAIIERLRDEGIAMKRNTAAHALLSEVRVAGSDVTSWALIHFNALGVNPTVAAAATAQLNSTAVAKRQTNRTR